MRLRRLLIHSDNSSSFIVRYRMYHIMITSYQYQIVLVGCNNRLYGSLNRQFRDKRKAEMKIDYPKPRLKKNLSLLLKIVPLLLTSLAFKCPTLLCMDR